MRKPYLIRTPEFNTTSGGIRVMWGLYGHLLAKGEVVLLNAQVKVPSIGIYPEIYTGNDMGCTTVVRYILNTPGVMGLRRGEEFTPGPTTFDPKDKLYYFSRLFGETDEEHYLFLPIINLKLFKDLKGIRKNTCYIVGKGLNKCIHPKDSIELTRDLSQDQEKLAQILNTCHTLYCYDKLTAMMEVARLCGVKVKYYGEYEEEELRKYEPGLNGIGFCGDDVKLDSDAFREHYMDMVELFNTKLDHFIEDTQI